MKQSIERRVAGEWFRKIGRTGLWILAIYAVSWTAVMVILHLVAKPFKWNEYIFHPGVTSISLLVLGIVMPLESTERYIAMGVTRVQLFRGMLAAAGGIVVIAVLLHAAVNAVLAAAGYPFIEARDIPLQALTDLVSHMFCFLLGLGVAVGFIRLRWYTPLVFVTSAVVCLNVSIWLIGTPAFWTQADALLPPALSLGIVALLSAGIAVFIVKAMRRLPLKS